VPPPPGALAHLRETLRCSGVRWTAALVADRVLPLGVMRLWRDRIVTRERLAAQVDAILRAWGMPDEHVPITIGHILYADLHGIDSHGCAMLLAYHRQRAAGRLEMRPIVAVVRESATTALLDGGGGLGHVPADQAMRLAIAKCRSAGVGVVAVRGSGHFGAAGSYAAMAVREGLIGLALTSVREPALVPTFGNRALFGTNPIAFDAPAGHEPPFLLDMATSAAAIGKLATAWRRGDALPAGLALDAYGQPQRSARLAFTERRLMPLGGRSATGGHKGYGLAAMGRDPVGLPARGAAAGLVSRFPGRHGAFLPRARRREVPTRRRVRGRPRRDDRRPARHAAARSCAARSGRGRPRTRRRRGTEALGHPPHPQRRTAASR